MKTMLVVLLFVASLFIIGCGDDGKDGVDGITGPSPFVQTHDTESHVDTIIDASGVLGNVVLCDTGYHASTASNEICVDGHGFDSNGKDLNGCLVTETWNIVTSVCDTNP